VRRHSGFLISLSIVVIGLAFISSAWTARAGQLAKPPAQTQQQNQQIAPPLPEQPPVQIPPVPPRPELSVVVLDAAHGGADSGARGDTGINESDITLEFARNVKPALEAQNFRVVETREDNEDPTFDDRSAVVNAQRGAVFVTLHVSSTGTPGQVRVYSEPLPGDSGGQTPTSPAAPGLTAITFPSHNGMLSWDHAQEPYAAASRRLAELVQVQLAQRFAGTSALPFTAQVRQLRTIAAPAIAVEVSSIAVTSRTQLTQMSHDLADAIAHGIVAFRPIYEEGAR
jgi:N-acetylmuramoyl-L-alanine amidase